jgi:hypothetical protein
LKPSKLLEKLTSHIFKENIMALPTAEEITNLFLYGTATRPGNLLDPRTTSY